MIKFARNYILQLETGVGGEVLEIKPPFTLEFDITRNILSSANNGSFRIYNLNKTNRNKIRKNQFDWGTFRRATLKAGYGDDSLSTVFDGNISQAWSLREGTDFITQIECFDAGFAYVNGNTNTTFPAGTPKTAILQSLAESLPHVSLGAIGHFPGSLSRGNAYHGSTADLLRDLTGGGFFIDCGVANCLKDNEVLEGTVNVIDSSSGLLGTPILEQTFLHFDLLFEPQLKIGQQIELKSLTADNFNGIYKIISLKHRGTISETICGNAVTSVGMTWGLSDLSKVSK